MPTLYYQDEHVTLYLGNSFEIMETMEHKSIDCVITDPPYTNATHKNAKSNKNGKGLSEIDFQPFTDKDLLVAFTLMGRITKSWVISTLDFQHAALLDKNPISELTMKRIGVWVKNNPMPQISADRPGMGWEPIAYLHRSDTKSKWNAGGQHGNYVSNLATPTGHPTPKPLAMISSFVERFTNANETILDPFAGGGTTLLAAKLQGRKAIGIELEEKYCELIANRLSQQTFNFEE